MEKISEMIKRLCPEGVECKLLSDFEERGDITLGRGNVISKTEIRDNPGTYPVYSSSSQNDGKIGEYGKYMFDDERITWSIDGGGILFYRNHHKYSVTNVGGWIKVNTDSLSTRFLYFYLYQQWTDKVFDYTHKAHPSVIRNEYLIPVLPLSIQLEIVRILDSFTSTITNLETELASRQKQYEYYRNKLLTFDENDESVEWKTLGEIVASDCSVSYGIVQPGDGITNGVPVVRPVDLVNTIVHNINLKNTTEEISNAYKRTILKGGDCYYVLEEQQECYLLLVMICADAMLHVALFLYGLTKGY